MFDFWSLFREGDDAKSSSSAASPVSSFFDSLFRQPSQSDPSSWNNYSTGYSLPAEADSVLRSSSTGGIKEESDQAAIGWTKGGDFSKRHSLGEDDAWGSSQIHIYPVAAESEGPCRSSSRMGSSVSAGAKPQGSPIQDSASGSSGSSPRKVADTRYYEALELTADAAPASIRKAYYRLALKCHPDKNPGDPEAHKKFQAIGEAYQVLNDPKRRAEYDKFGVSATRNMNFIDPALFFMMLFGSEHLDPYIGKLKMAKLLEVLTQDDFMAAMSGEAPEGAASQAREGLLRSVEDDQKRREVMLGILLRDRVQLYVQGEEEVWKEKMSSEIESLCKASFGETIVESLGWAYENFSSAYLGEVQTVWGLGAAVANVQATSRSIGNTFAMAKSMVQAAVAATDIQARHEQKLKASKESTDAPDAGSLPNRLDTQDINRVGEILQSILLIVACDVEDTARKAAEKVCRDESVPLGERVRRAEALRWLGETMVAAGAKGREQKKQENFDVSRHMEDAFIRATKAADEKSN